MSTFFEKHLSECEYQELPSGFLIAKHQIMLPESNIFVPNSGLLHSECTSSIASDMQIHGALKNMFASTDSRLTIMVKGR